MKHSKLYAVLFGTAFLLFLGASISILFMPLASIKAAQGIRRYLYYTGGGFWSTLVLGYIFAVILKIMQKKEKIPKDRRLSVFRFFSNLPARVFDSLMITSICVFGLLILADKSGSYVSCIVLAISFFSIHMHGMFNSLYIKKEKC